MYLSLKALTVKKYFNEKIDNYCRSNEFVHFDVITNKQKLFINDKFLFCNGNRDFDAEWNKNNSMLTPFEIQSYITKMREEQKKSTLSKLDVLSIDDMQLMKDMKRFGLMKMFEKEKPQQKNKLYERAENLVSLINENNNLNFNTELLNEMKKIGIEKLPYSYSSLKQFIDQKTMNIHYNKHYKGYVDKLNKALSKKDFGDLELEEIIRSISRFPKDIRNNAGGAFNHAMFWKMLSPTKQDCTGDLLKQIGRAHV